MLAAAYIIASTLFIISIKLLSKQNYARLGNGLSALAMLIAMVATMMQYTVLNYELVFTAIGLGFLVGLGVARLVKMTAMPQTVGLLNGSGGLASLLVAVAESTRVSASADFQQVVIALTILIGGVTFAGSIVAFLKLARLMPSRPIVAPLHRVINGCLLIASITALLAIEYYPAYQVILLSAGIALILILGISAVMTIGGADMPVVISLLNSYSGIAACLAGFILSNNMIIVGGALVGASGFVLTMIMCKSMNRSLATVLFGAKRVVHQEASTSKKPVAFTPKAINPVDAYYRLEAARTVMIVPGYGMAVAQAQHALSELGDILESNGAEVYFAIHPVAGRMPGHMNVLLAEAGIPYDKFVEPDTANPLMPNIDVCVIVGANDVVNPAARDRKDTPIYGMPIIDADKANTVLIIKRSLATGFAGVDNDLFYKDNTIFLFGDAKMMLTDVILEFRDQLPGA